MKQSSNRFHFLKFWNCNFWEHTLLILQPKDDNHVTPLPLWKILDLSLLPVVYLPSYCYSYLTYATLSIKTSEELKSLGTIKNAWILIIFAEDCKFLVSRSSIVQALCCLNSYNFQGKNFSFIWPLLVPSLRVTDMVIWITYWISLLQQQVVTKELWQSHLLTSVSDSLEISHLLNFVTL